MKMIFTMSDGETIELKIPAGISPTQFFESLRHNGYIESADRLTFWNFSSVKKAEASAQLK